MHGLDPFEAPEDDGTVFRDVITLALAGFVALVLLILPHINPEARASADQSEPPGNVIVEVRWPDSVASDVDLWVQAPGDIPVGYSNKGGALFNLLRDDLGDLLDATKLNYEIAYSRGLAPGEYTVNLHLYRNAARVSPIPVSVVVSVKEAVSQSARQILATQVDLTREGEETTALRFRLGADGRLEKGSVHSLFKPLRDTGSKS